MVGGWVGGWVSLSSYQVVEEGLEPVAGRQDDAHPPGAGGSVGGWLFEEVTEQGGFATARQAADERGGHGGWVVGVVVMVVGVERGEEAAALGFDGGGEGWGRGNEEGEKVWRG